MLDFEIKKYGLNESVNQDDSVVCDFSDYELYQLLEGNNFKTTVENLQLLKEGIASGKYGIEIDLTEDEKAELLEFFNNCFADNEVLTEGKLGNKILHLLVRFLGEKSLNKVLLKAEQKLKSNKDSEKLKKLIDKVEKALSSNDKKVKRETIYYFIDNAPEKDKQQATGRFRNVVKESIPKDKKAKAELKENAELSEGIGDWVKKLTGGGSGGGSATTSGTTTEKLFNAKDLGLSITGSSTTDVLSGTVSSSSNVLNIDPSKTTSALGTTLGIEGLTLGKITGFMRTKEAILIAIAVSLVLAGITAIVTHIVTKKVIRGY